MERERVPYSISLNGLRVISGFWGGSGFNGVLVTWVLGLVIWGCSPLGAAGSVSDLGSGFGDLGLQPLRGCREC